MTPKIAVIDCSTILTSTFTPDSSEFQQFATKLGNGLRETGYVYLINHGIPQQTYDNAFEATKTFFELPKGIKSQYKKKNPVESFTGWTCATDESNRGNKAYDGDKNETWDTWGVEAFNELGYPKEIPSFRTSLFTFKQQTNALAYKLLAALGMYLELESPNILVGTHKCLEDPEIRNHAIMRTSYYPPIPDSVKDEEIPENDIRFVEHQDWGTLTILVQDMLGGLEAKMRSGGYIPVQPIQNALVVNVGIPLEILSGGLLLAPFHRVKLARANARKLRQSFAYSIKPDGDTFIKPLRPQQAEWVQNYSDQLNTETQWEFFRRRIQSIFNSTN